MCCSRYTKSAAFARRLKRKDRNLPAVALLSEGPFEDRSPRDVTCLDFLEPVDATLAYDGEIMPPN